MNYKNIDFKEIKTGPIEAGDYTAKISFAEEVVTAKGVTYVKVGLDIDKGITLTGRHIVDGSSPQGVNYGLSMLKKLAEAIGEQTFAGFPEVLVGKLVGVRVSIVESTQYGFQNQVEDYFDYRTLAF